MAKSKSDPIPATDPARGDPAPAAPALRIGDSVNVVVADGALLRNNESGTWFVDGESTPQTVTATLLRRLQDGDLVLAPQRA